MANTNKLLTEWPGPVVVVDPAIGDNYSTLRSSIETGFAWTQAHPVVDAYKAYKPMPYDAPTATLAAVLHAVRPQEDYFKLSEPGSNNPRRRQVEVGCRHPKASTASSSSIPPRRNAS